MNALSSVQSLIPTLYNLMDCSMPGLLVRHQLLELAQNSCPSSWWFHPTISSSVIPFSSCRQSFPASGSFPMSQFFASDGQVLEVRFQPSNEYWVLIFFRKNWLDLLAVQGTLKCLLQHQSWKASIECSEYTQKILLLSSYYSRRRLGL